jgi:hypothetical protein
LKLSGCGIFSKPRKAEKSPSKSKPLLGLRRAGAVQRGQWMQPSGRAPSSNAASIGRLNFIRYTPAESEGLRYLTPQSVDC